jgi:L-asparagine transporter-like permease
MNYSIIIQIIHLLITICVALLPLLSSKYDFLYFFMLLILALGWNIFKGECLISYYEKKFQNPEYKLGTNNKVPFKNLLGEKITNLIMGSHFLIIPYVLYRNHKRKNFIILIILLLIIIFLLISYIYKKKSNNQTYESK